jgi:tRNA(Met) C34 N-acetyltransferase TmcA
VLGQTFGMLVLQDYEAITPNLLARTIETVEGGGIVVLLLKTMSSLKQLYTMAMVRAHVMLIPLGADKIGRTFPVQDRRTSICPTKIQRAIHLVARIMPRLFATG